MSTVAVQFTELPEKFTRVDYLQLFSQFGSVKKLYINPNFSFGVVYFETFKEATTVYEELNKNPSVRLLFSEPHKAEIYNRNKTRLLPIMNRSSSHLNNYEHDLEGCYRKFQYVDVFGRLITTIEAEDGNIYIPLNELKKSGFELFEAGTLPKPGQVKSFDEQVLYQFEMYLKMKAAKFIAVHKLQVSQDNINEIIKREVGQHTDSKRSVKIDSSGLLQISASQSNANHYCSLKGISLHPDELANSDNYTQKTRHAMSGLRSLNSGNKSNNTSNGNLRNSPQNYNLTSKISGRSYPQNRNLSKQHTNSNNKSTNNQEFKQQNVGRGIHNTQFEKLSKFSLKRNTANQYRSDNEDIDNLSVTSSGRRADSDTTKLCTGKNINTFVKNRDDANQMQTSVSSRNFVDEEAIIKTQTVSYNGLKPQPSSEIPNLELTIDSALMKTTDHVTENEMSNLQKVSESNTITSFNNNELQIEADPNIPLESINLRKSVVEIDSVDSGIFECTDLLTVNTCVAFVFPNMYSTQLLELESISDETKSDPSFKPNIGDLVAVLKDGAYVRGTVINKDDAQYICALIDYGIVVSVDSARQLPNKYKEIPEFTCFCALHEKAVHDDIVANGESNILVTITAPGKLLLKMESIGKEHQIVATKWNPFETSPLAAKNFAKIFSPLKENNLESSIETTSTHIYKLKPPQNALKNGDVVIIAAVRESCLLLRTKECTSLLKEVNQEFGKYEVKPLTKPLEVGQLAAALFNENSFYRVAIQSTHENMVNVEYIDYGDSDTVPIDFLLTINEKLAQIPNTLIKIILRGYMDIQFNDKSLSVLRSCHQKKEKFTVVETDNENEYDLLYTDKSSLSERLKQLNQTLVEAPGSQHSHFTPHTTMESTNVPEPRIMINDLPQSKFKIGNNEVMCMYTGDMKEGNVSFCLTGSETADLLMKVQFKIAEHISGLITFYKPEIDEICLAKYADEWHRACVTENDGNCYTVYYIDFGNSHVVESSDICQIPKELAKIEPLASLCILKDVMIKGTEAIQEPLFSKMQNDLQENEVYTINVIDNIQGYLIITIPNLYDNWKQAGLL